MALASQPPLRAKTQQNLLRGMGNIFIVATMSEMLVFSLLFFVLSGVLLARLPLRAKLLPLLRRAR